MQETLVQFPGLGRSAEEGISCPFQYSWASLVAQLLRIRPQCRRPGFSPWVGKIPWKRERQTPQYSGLENFMDCIVHGGAESQTRLSAFGFLSTSLCCCCYCLVAYTL